MKYLLIGLLCLSQASAHSWYDAVCCNDKDCRPIPCNELIKVQQGYTYHNIIFYLIPRPSQDLDCHACFSDNSLVGHCLYLPGIS